MELAKTEDIIFQIEYKGIGISKISQHLTAESAEEELRNFKKNIKKSELKNVMKNINVYKIEKLKIINLGKNL